MQFLSNKLRTPKTEAATTSATRWIALALPLAVAAGCSSSKLIDYTVSEEVYLEATTPVEALPELPQLPELPTLSELPASSTESEPENDAEELPFLTDQPKDLPYLSDSKPLKSITLAEAPLPFLPGHDKAPELPPALPMLPDPLPLTPPPLPQTSVTAIESAVTAPEVVAQNKAFEMPALSQPQLQPEMPQAEPQEPTLAAAIVDKAYINQLKFTPAIYTAATLGGSRLNPDTTAAPGWEVNDSIAGAGQIAFGVDLFKRLSLEVHSADYGSAGMTDGVSNGRVNYHMNGVSALIYAGPELNRFRRRGFNGYARIGFNHLENTSIGNNNPFVRQTSQHGSFGLGAEYNTRFGLGLRADVVAYDGDVQAGQLGMIYRMGWKPRRPALAAASPDQLPTLPTPPTLPNLPTLSPPPPPTQANLPPAPQLGYALPAESAPALVTYETTGGKASAQQFTFQEVSTLPMATTVQSEYADDCTALNGALTDVHFHRGSARLTSTSATALSEIATTLKSCEHRNLVVSAHTDSEGTAMQNNELSTRRARAVAMYLGRNGVAMDRMKAVAFGESRPVASNDTQDGRRQNRRVELTVR